MDKKKQQNNKVNDNKKFWSKTARIYERFIRGGKSANQAYTNLESEITLLLTKKMDVLELAAGPGMLSGKIARACGKLEVTDFSPEMVEQAKKRGLPSNVTFSVADATKLPYKTGTFDAVVIANALHIMPEPEKAVAEMKRVLKEDGILIAPTFTRENVKSKLVEKLMEAVGFRTYSRWTHATYKEFLRNQGLTIIKSATITGHNFPISFYACKRSA